LAGFGHCVLGRHGLSLSVLNLGHAPLNLSVPGCAEIRSGEALDAGQEFLGQAQSLGGGPFQDLRFNGAGVRRHAATIGHGETSGKLAFSP
jgi:hypothetical protein